MHLFSICIFLTGMRVLLERIFAIVRWKDTDCDIVRDTHVGIMKVIKFRLI